MPRTAKPRKPDIEELDDEVQGEELPTAPDEIEELIASLAGDRQVMATVYRDRGEGEKAVDRIPIRPEMSLDDVLVQLAKKWGHGRYRLQLRELNKRGTLGNVTLPEIEQGAFGCAAVESPAPPAPAPTNPMMEMLQRQNEQYFSLLREQLVKQPAAPSPVASLQEQMQSLGMMFRFARGLSKASGEAELPGWMDTIGKFAAPIIATVAENLKPKPPAPPPRKPVESVSSPATPPATTVAASPAVAVEEDDDDEPSPVDVAVQRILTDAAGEASPSADAYAASILHVARDEFTALAKALPEGKLAEAAMVQLPALKEKAEFCRNLETALRARITPANGVAHAA